MKRHPFLLVMLAVLASVGSGFSQSDGLIDGADVWPRSQSTAYTETLLN